MIRNKFHLLLHSALSGIILSLGWPMYGFPFLLFFGFVPLLFVEDFITRRPEFFHRYSIFGYAYLSFFVWNLFTTWWIWNSTIFGAVMAVLLNSLFMALVFLIFHLSKKSFRHNPNAILLLILYWISFEYLHLDWDLSWPWLNLGNGFAMFTQWVQWYEFTGTAGGTLWILLLNIMIFRLIKAALNRPLLKTKVISNAVVLAVFFITPMIISRVMYQNYEEKGPVAEMIVTQPNVDPWTEQYSLPPRVVIKKNLDLAEPLITPETDFIIMPESAIQEDIWHNSVNSARSIRRLREYIAQHPNINIIIGASTFRLFCDDEPLTRTARKFSDVEKYYEAFNTAFFINANDTVGMYHKSKLVPGPEKMPFQRLLRPLQHLAFDLGGTVGSLGFSTKREVFTSTDGRFHVPGIICYESIYGDFVAGFVRNGADILVIITNDGWWGNTAGHRQHFAFAPLRAVETRRAVARSANTGISGFVNQRGDIIEASNYWEPAALKAGLRANSEITFYVKYGDYIGRISAFITVFLLLIALVNGVLEKRRR
ncbi:MAG: apolipoprotein N-acyltransferase [Bacteroidales bacterium]